MLVPDQPEGWSGRAFKTSTKELGFGTVLHPNTHTSQVDWKRVTKPLKGDKSGRVIALPKHKTPLERAHKFRSPWQTAPCLLGHASLITQLSGSGLLCAQLAQFPGRASSAPPRNDTHLKWQLFPLGARISLVLGLHGLLPGLEAAVSRFTPIPGSTEPTHRAKIIQESLIQSKLYLP